MDDLPDEVLTHLVGIAPSAVADLAPVSKRLCRIATDDLLWKALYTRRFGPPQSTGFLDCGKDWRWLYRAQLPVDLGHRGDLVGTARRGNLVYSGDLLDGLPHGWGIMVNLMPRPDSDTEPYHHSIYCNPTWVPHNHLRPSTLEDEFTYVERYEGEWRRGMRHGMGTTIYTRGDRHSGKWHDGRRCGDGVYEATNWRIECIRHWGRYADITATAGGYVWTGKVETSVFSGTLSMRHIDGARAMGDIVKGRFEGIAIVTCADGTHYAGQCYQGRPRGVGTLILPDGRRYETSWIDGAPHGAGLVVYPDGSRRESTWEKGKRTSTALYHAPSAIDPCVCLACAETLDDICSDRRLMPRRWPTERTIHFLGRLSYQCQ
ncbi:Morn repeat domain containing protein [Pandoravirus salinus]|uniref:Morn repeat domain containing protein n=1 Tax=Pandoravirus salinus TaxID=1349410 RepID=S4VVQ7_9VIRU|nr:morn repeat domain [Pandoravirus salinus]AGO84443.1 Morn repeat domain containing protein [Pandoravirus salinus]